MLEDKGNTAVYLLYMYTRIRSIARLANVEPKQLLNYAKNKGIKIEDPKEIKLAKVCSLSSMHLLYQFFS